MDDGSNSWEAWALGPSSRAPPAGHRTIGFHDPSIPARKKAPAHHTRPGVGTRSSWPRQPTGGDGLSRHDGSPVDKTWFSCRYGAPRATLGRNPPSRRPPWAVFRNRWERAADAGGSGNSEGARTEINCFSKRHLETPQPRLVFQQEERVAAETGEERCKIIQKQALPLRSLRVHYNQRKERAAGRYRPSHHHPAASYAGTDGLHKAARATGCHGGRGRHHVRAGERVDQAQLPFQKTPPKTAKTRVDLPQPSRLDRLLDASTREEQRRRGPGSQTYRRRQTRCFCGFHRPIPSKKKQTDGLSQPLIRTPGDAHPPNPSSYQGAGQQRFVLFTKTRVVRGTRKSRTRAIDNRIPPVWISDTRMTRIRMESAIN